MLAAVLIVVVLAGLLSGQSVTVDIGVPVPITFDVTPEAVTPRPHLVVRYRVYVDGVRQEGLTFTASGSSVRSELPPFTTAGTRTVQLKSYWVIQTPGTWRCATPTAIPNECAEVNGPTGTVTVQPPVTPPTPVPVNLVLGTVQAPPAPEPVPAPTPTPTPQPTPAPIPPPPPSSDRNGYYSALTQRGDFWKGYSLRDQAQLLQPRLGGFAAANSYPLDINYDPAVDAAKVVVPPFSNPTNIKLAADVSADATQIPLTDSSSAENGIVVKIDAEILMVTAKAGTGAQTVLTVTRGAYGTTPALHAVGAAVARGGNSIANTVNLPMQTENGHRYLTTWDAWFSPDLRMPLSGLKNWKTFQFLGRKSVGGSTGIWFEVRTRFDGGSAPMQLPLSDTMIGAVDVRGYSTPAGPNVTSQEPITPRLATFAVRPATWTRYWMLLEQRTSDPDWDLVSLWVADESTDAVQILDRRQVQAYGLVSHFMLEFNTSTTTLKEGRGDLVTYVRNVAMLRDVADVPPLFQRPVR